MKYCTGRSVSASGTRPSALARVKYCTGRAAAASGTRLIATAAGRGGRRRQRRPGGAPGFSQTLRPAPPPVSPRLTTEALRTEGWPGSCGQQTERLRHPQLGTRAPAAVSSSCGRVRLRHHPPRAPLGPRAIAPPGACAGRLRLRRPWGRRGSAKYSGPRVPRRSPDCSASIVALRRRRRPWRRPASPAAPGPSRPPRAGTRLSASFG